MPLRATAMPSPGSATPWRPPWRAGLARSEALALSPADAELLFQVLDERSELSSTITTTNLPFGEWTKVFPEPRLCKAVVDRLASNAHIIETGRLA